MNKNKFKKLLNKFWFIVWKDESLRGWIISIIFIFIIIKLIFFPLLNLVTGTTLPLAIVESCSMYHQGNTFSNYNLWWNKHEIKYLSIGLNKEDFSSFTFKNGFSKGDILFILKAKADKLKVGDIIIFNAGRNHPIIHRIINIKQKDGKYIFSTMGDNNNGQLTVEKEISEDALVGKAIFRITPTLGWGKLIFYEHSKPNYERGFCKEN